MAPVGEETESDENFDDQICCLKEKGERCRREVGSSTFSQRMYVRSVQKKLNLTLSSQVKHRFICDMHREMILGKRKQKETEDSGDSGAEVNLSQLQVSTLRRYKKFFKVSSKVGLNKAQLLEAIYAHFQRIQVREREVVPYFVHMVKNRRNRLDQRQVEAS